MRTVDIQVREMTGVEVIAIAAALLVLTCVLAAMLWNRRRKPPTNPHT